MDNLNIQFHYLIAHIINLNENEPQLSSGVYSIPDLPDKIINFFKKHIIASRTSRNTKSCVFTGNPSYIEQKINNLSETDKSKLEEEFVQFSKDITIDLFEKMQQSSSRSSGSIFIILCTVDSKKFIIILKMDPNEGIQIIPETLELKLQENMLPNPKDKLHKCAFIKYDVDFNDEEIHLFVLDKQQTKGEVSKFFMTLFLKAREKSNDKLLTDYVKTRIIDDYLSIIPKDKKFEFGETLDKLFCNGVKINIEEDFKKLISPYFENDVVIDENVEKFKSSLIQKYPDAQFEFTVIQEKHIIKWGTKDENILLKYPKDLSDDIKITCGKKSETIITINKDHNITKLL